MKRVDFVIEDHAGKTLREPGFVECCTELPLAVMRAVEDFLQVHGGDWHLPITIRLQPSGDPTGC